MPTVKLQYLKASLKTLKKILYGYNIQAIKHPHPADTIHSTQVKRQSSHPIRQQSTMGTTHTGGCQNKRGEHHTQARTSGGGMNPYCVHNTWPPSLHSLILSTQCNPLFPGPSNQKEPNPQDLWINYNSTHQQARRYHLSSKDCQSIPVKVNDWYIYIYIYIIGLPETYTIL